MKKVLWLTNYPLIF